MIKLTKHFLISTVKFGEDNDEWNNNLVDANERWEAIRIFLDAHHSIISIIELTDEEIKNLRDENQKIDCISEKF